MRDPAEILNDALALPSEARAALAGWLLDSLDPRADGDAEAAWAIEIHRRAEEINQNRAQTVPWAELRRRLAGD